MHPHDEPLAGALQAIGLDPEEEAAYEFLLNRPPATLGDLARAWSGPGRLDALLSALEVKGLVERLSGDRLSAVAPDVALDALILEQEQRLHHARVHADQLVGAYRKQASACDRGPVVEVVTGDRAVRQRLAQIQSSARQELRCMDKPPYVDQDGTSAAELYLLNAGVACRTIYDRASVEQPAALPGIEALIGAGLEARVLPQLPMKLYLTDDRFGVLALERDPATTIIVHPCTLLDALGDLFEGLWQRALPLDLSARNSRPGPSAASDQRLIALLLSGLTDEAIARQLGVGYRTAQRRVAALMENLDAKTRFQAGVQAALREAQPAPASSSPHSRPAHRTAG